MRQALDVAREGMARGELPIGAVVVAQDRVIASAYTQERAQGRFLVHADLLALEAADRISPFPGKRRDATLYVNLEPCLMCMGAVMSAFVGTVVYGLESPGDGAVRFMPEFERPHESFPGYRAPVLRGGVLRDASIALFGQYAAKAPPGPMQAFAASLAKLGQSEC